MLKQVMKTCSKCKEEKAESEFRRKKDKVLDLCKACSNAYMREYYKEYSSRKPETYRLKNRKNKARQAARTREILWQAKQRPCADCGQWFHPWIMEFDHREGTKKLYNVSNIASSGCPDKRLLDEIAKCELVCANCHRMRTFKQRLQKANDNEAKRWQEMMEKFGRNPYLNQIDEENFIH